MSGEHAWSRSAWHLLLALGLLSGGGCLTTDRTAPEPPPGGGGQSMALPPAAGAGVCIKLAASYEREGLEQEAANQYLLARQQDPTVKVARQLAVLFDKLGQQKLAQQEFQTALEQSPRDADLLNSVGYFYYNCGKLEDAEAKLRAALAINPKYQHAWRNLGLVLGAQKRYADSLEAFEQVASKGEAHSDLAFVLSAQGRVAEAKEEYKQALQLEPNQPRARLALDKLEHPGKAAPPPLTQVEAARKAAAERLLAQPRTPATPPQPVAAVQPTRREPQPAIIVTPPSMREEEAEDWQE